MIGSVSVRIGSDKELRVALCFRVVPVHLLSVDAELVTGTSTNPSYYMSSLRYNTKPTSCPPVGFLAIGNPWCASLPHGYRSGVPVSLGTTFLPFI
jgi:hypothetical protein